MQRSRMLRRRSNEKQRMGTLICRMWPRRPVGRLSRSVRSERKAERQGRKSNGRVSAVDGYLSGRVLGMGRQCHDHPFCITSTRSSASPVCIQHVCDIDTTCVNVLSALAESFREAWPAQMSRSLQYTQDLLCEPRAAQKLATSDASATQDLPPTCRPRGRQS